MKHFLFPVLLLLTLPACLPNRSDNAASDSESLASDADPMLAIANTSANVYSPAPVHWQAALEQGKEQYASVHQWLRQEGLTGLTHVDLVAAAKTSEAASRYVDCHAQTQSLSGADGRLESLSSCLRREADEGGALEDAELTAGNGAEHSNTEVATLDGAAL